METGRCQKPSFAGEWVIALVFVRGMVIIFVSACSYSNGCANNEFLFGKKGGYCYHLVHVKLRTLVSYSTIPTCFKVFLMY